MAMGTERSNSKALHNFSMPRLKWGNQRFLRCVKLSSEEAEEDEAIQQHNSLSFHNSYDIEAVREKLMIDPRVATDKLKGSIFEEGNLNPNPTRPWNLRTRRASCTNLFNSLAQTPNDNDDKKKKKKRKMNEKKRPKFCVSLSKEEIEQDFWALVGIRPPRRPKKRPRILQNQLDTLFPGLWLSEVTAESYKLPDVPE